MDPQMEKMMQIMDKEFTSGKRIFEINTSHPLIKNLSDLNQTDSFDPMLRKSIVQLYESTMLIEGYLKSPNDFVKRLYEIMEKATQK